MVNSLKWLFLSSLYVSSHSLTLSSSLAVIPVLRRDNPLWLSVGDGSLFIRDGTGAVPYKLSALYVFSHSLTE